MAVNRSDAGYVHLGANVRRIRRECELSQTALGVRAGGLRQAYISDLEYGRAPWRDEHVDALARALGVSRAVLLAAPPRRRAVPSLAQMAHAGA